MDETAEYICPSCGESILIAIDPTGGDEQEYIEDCPVCCRPNEIRVRFDRQGRGEVTAASS